MTDKPARLQTTIALTCRCGASISVTTSGIRSARTDAGVFRQDHQRCLQTTVDHVSGFRPGVERTAQW